MTYEEKVNYIIANRPPLSKRGKKIYDIINNAGGKIKTWNMTFSRAIGLASTGQNDFLTYLDECIEKDYVRVYFSKQKAEKNWFFTFEHWSFVVLPKLETCEVSQVHNQYIEDKLLEVQPRTEPHCSQDHVQWQ
jgi:hypothetical protein